MKNRTEIGDDFMGAEEWKQIMESAQEALFQYDKKEDTFIVAEIKKGRYLIKYFAQNYLADFDKITKIHPDDRHHLKKILKEDGEKTSFRNVQCRIAFEPKRYHWYRISASYIEDEKKDIRKVIGKMEQMDKESEERKRYLKWEEKEEWIGVYNRRRFEKKLQSMLQEKKEGSAIFIMIDIDDFREVNEKNGYPYGDVVLRETAKILWENFHEDGICGRIGGDEFAVFVPKMIPHECLKEKMESLFRQVRERKVIREEMRFSISAGISIKEKEKANFNAFYQEADQAIYDAKQIGKDCYVVYSHRQTHHKRMKKALLIVDDQQINREILKGIFQDHYRFLEAENGLKAIECLEERHDSIAAILLDLVMPYLDGFGVLEYMRKKDYLKDIPAILITGENTPEIQKAGYELGVSDIINKTFDPYLVRRRVANIVELYYHKNNLEELVEQQTRKLTRQNVRMINVLGTVVEFRNMESGEHIARVRGLTRILLERVADQYPEYCLTSEEVQMIVDASPMHDVGKIMISDSILMKPGKLTPEEFEIMKTHTVKGCEIIEQIADLDDKKYLRYCSEIARSHHERFDGRGYPDGLRGEEIPISAQVVSIADVYDALVSERVYKKAFTKEEAYRMILNGECGVFNQKLIACFREVRSQMEELAEQ